MKSRGLFLTTLGLALALGTIVYADCGKCGHGDEKPMGNMMGKMTEELKLTPDQVTKIETIKKEKHDKMQALHEECREKIKAVLNDEQKAKFEAMHKPGADHKMMCGDCGTGKCAHEGGKKHKKMKKGPSEK